MPVSVAVAEQLILAERERRRRARALAATMAPTQDDAAAWARLHRFIGGAPFTIMPPLEALYASKHPRLIVRKAAQVMISEYLINIALWVADTGQGGRGNCLYAFPKERQLKDFSRARVNKAIEESRNLAHRVDGNLGLKRVGKGVLYLRGATNRESLISVDADCVLCDEMAQYDIGTVDTLSKRLGSSLLGWIRAASTPRFPADEAGVLWEQSTKQVYEVRCSHCGRWQALDILTHLDAATATVRCAGCQGDMSADRLSVGHWVAEAPGREWEGYHVSKLLSPRANLGELAKKLKLVQDGRALLHEVQEFYNSDAGLPYLPEGGHLSPDDLEACSDPDYVAPHEATHTVMGVDVGSRLHVRIDKIKERGDADLIFAGSFREFEELDPLMARFDVDRCVVDANPETREAKRFSERWVGRVWLAYYTNVADGAPATLCTFDPKRRGVVHISRTVALDHVIERVRQRRLRLPRDWRELGGEVNGTGYGEYVRHLGSPIRVLGEDARGNPVARYDQNGPDHLAHAEVYCLVAGARGLVGIGDYPEEEPEIDDGSPEDELPVDPRRAPIRRLTKEEIASMDLGTLLAPRPATGPIAQAEEVLDMSSALFPDDD